MLLFGTSEKSLPKICEILDENLKNLIFLEIPSTLKFQRLSKCKNQNSKHFQNFKDFFKSTACYTDGFVILSERNKQKSTLKCVNSHFKILDTSLCYTKFSMTKIRQYDKGKINRQDKAV